MVLNNPCNTFPTSALVFLVSCILSLLRLVMSRQLDNLDVMDSHNKALFILNKGCCLLPPVPNLLTF